MFFIERERDMIRLGTKVVRFLDKDNNELKVKGAIIINNDIVDIDNGKIIIFKERVVSISDEGVTV